jgi:predicted nuclease of predicted toxin-antitoxin system
MKRGQVPLRFYFDTHIARASAVQLRAKGIDVVRCEEVNMAEAIDEDHLVYATNAGRILVSQDADFIILNARWRQTDRSHAGIMKVPPNLSDEAQISYVVQQLSFSVEAEQAGAVDYTTEIANQVIFL